MYPGAEFQKQFFSTSTDPRYAEIGQNRFIVAKSWDQYDQLLEQVFSNNDGVYLTFEV